MGDYLFKDLEGPDLDHPDSAIRLGSVVHRFKVPRITKPVSFQNSFSTVGKNDKTRRLMKSADDARERLSEGANAAKVSAERVVADARRYQPLIHSILLSCKVQPEQARLDERLVFEWKSGIEDKPKAYRSEAMMYDLVMDVAAQGLGHALSATEHSVAGDFAAASREYATAAGIMNNLANDQLPKWIAKGSRNMKEDQLPVECSPAVCKALVTLFGANGQQMAVATLLMKDGKPNYGLIGKLCLGIAEQLEEFVSMMRREAFDAMGKITPDFFTLLTLQINVQKSLTLYFQSRAAWEKEDHGTAIALLSEASVQLQPRPHAAAEGVPDVQQFPALCALHDDLKDLRSHMALLLRAWEKDNSRVFFAKVPQRVPATSKLAEGHQMKKMAEFVLEEAEPVLLELPDGALKRSDSDLARELQHRINLGEDDM
jgi:BRO1-like domain